MLANNNPNNDINLSRKTDWAVNCIHLSSTFFVDVFTEETLTEHEHQVATVKNYYEENKEMFKLVDKRENLWKKKLDFEVSVQCLFYKRIEN